MKESINLVRKSNTKYENPYENRANKNREHCQLSVEQNPAPRTNSIPTVDLASVKERCVSWPVRTRFVGSEVLRLWEQHLT
jgi:hypothetical protein